MTEHKVPPPVARPAYRSIVPVIADDAPAPLHLADNTNLFGAPPAALRALAAVEPAELVHYPPSSGPRLRDAIGAYLGVEPNAIVLGCGADDVIDCALRAFCEPGDHLAFPDPTFVMARYFAVTNNLQPVPIPFCGDGALDVDALVAANARAVYLCAPNNPSGRQPAASELRALLDRFSGLVLLDEAYAEFAGETLTAQAAQHGRLVVIRTLSKAFGLAGLRVGYAVATPALTREIEKARGPFPVSNVALRAAYAVLTDDLEWMRATVREAIAARDELVRLLRERAFAPLPSAANFVLVPVANARASAAHLAGVGIAVRAFTQLPGIGDALRITVAPVESLRRVATALAKATG